MKVIFIVLFVAVAAVCAFPAENNPEEILVALESEPVGNVAEINDGLIRDKRQYGGEYLLKTRCSPTLSSIKKLLSLIYFLEKIQDGCYDELSRIWKKMSFRSIREDSSKITKYHIKF